jgi:Ca-activated chloride channel homolog
MTVGRVGAVILAWALLASGLAGCSGGGPGPAATLRVLAGSELADLRPVLDAAAKATGVAVTMELSGTLEAAETVAAGKADGRYDAVWLSSNRYLDLVPEAAGRLGPRTKIMNSPVVLGLRASTAHRLGWDRAPVTWADIAAAAGRGEFSYGMTDPSASNSGFSALVGVTAALARTGSALDAATIERVAPELTRFFTAQKLSAGSSGYLTDAYVRRGSGASPGAPVNGLINYESVLLAANANGSLPEPFALVYPTDGVVTADYPLTLLRAAGDPARDAYTRLVDYLRRPDTQREIMRTTKRRPAIPGVPLEPDIPGRPLIELPFPGNRSAVDALLAAYFDRFRRPSRTVYVLDVSGSMDGAAGHPRGAGLPGAVRRVGRTRYGRGRRADRRTNLRRQGRVAGRRVSRHPWLPVAAWATIWARPRT